MLKSLQTVRLLLTPTSNRISAEQGTNRHGSGPMTAEVVGKIISARVSVNLPQCSIPSVVLMAVSGSGCSLKPSTRALVPPHRSQGKALTLAKFPSHSNRTHWSLLQGRRGGLYTYKVQRASVQSGQIERRCCLSRRHFAFR